MNLLKMVTMLHIFEEISGNLAGLDVDLPAAVLQVELQHRARVEHVMHVCRRLVSPGRQIGLVGVLQFDVPRFRLVHGAEV